MGLVQPDAESARLRLAGPLARSAASVLKATKTRTTAKMAVCYGMTHRAESDDQEIEQHG
jgi:hypothetical protein